MHKTISISTLKVFNILKCTIIALANMTISYSKKKMDVVIKHIGRLLKAVTVNSLVSHMMN